MLPSVPHVCSEPAMCSSVPAPVSFSGCLPCLGGGHCSTKKSIKRKKNIGEEEMRQFKEINLGTWTLGTSDLWFSLYYAAPWKYCLTNLKMGSSSEYERDWFSLLKILDCFASLEPMGDNSVDMYLQYYWHFHLHLCIIILISRKYKVVWETLLWNQAGKHHFTSRRPCGCASWAAE